MSIVPFPLQTICQQSLGRFETNSLGLKIGTTYVGCPTCVDDIALLGSSQEELQCMLSVALNHANRDRVTIHPSNF